MEKVKVGIVGLGGIAQVIHLPILSRLPDVEIFAVCDLDKSKAQYVAEKYGVKRYYTRVTDMLQQGELQAVDVCTTTSTHCEVALVAVEAGCDIMVEKPLARNFAEAAQIVDAAKKNKRKLMVGMNNRFRPDAMILKSFIENGELGNLFYVKAGWLKKQSSDSPWFIRKEKAGGGAFLDLGIVMVDLALWMLKYPEAKQATATMYSHTTKNVEDSCLAFLKMKNGATVSIEISWTFRSASDFFYCDCYGTDGSASINPLLIHKLMHGSLVNVTPVKMDTAQNLYKRSYQNELKHFVGAVRGLLPIVSTGEEALARMKIVDAIYKSAEKGKEINVN